MARGQVLTIPNLNASLITTSTKEEMDAVAVLNPNDGIIYIKLNGAAGPTPSQWDWKLPSQSYGLFPGPWISLGLYYIDQSGSQRTAEINVYDSQDKLYTPYIQAIGRAVQSAGTTVDISQGAQPQNPPASTVRMWADGSGNLHYLESSGTDHTLIDNRNYNTYITMTGDVIGPLTNTQVRVRNAAQIQFLDSGGAPSSAISNLGITDTFFLNNVGWHWVNLANSVSYMTLSPTVLDMTVNLHSSGKISAGPDVAFTAGDISANRGGGLGYIYFGGGANYFGYDGVQMFTPKAITSGGLVYGQGNVKTNSQYLFDYPPYIVCDPSSLFLRGANIYIQTTGGAPTTMYVGNVFSAGGFATGTQFSAGWPIAGDINVQRGSTGTGYVFLGSQNWYVGYDGSQILANTHFRITGNLAITGTIFSGMINNDAVNTIYRSPTTGTHHFQRGSDGAYTTCFASAFSPTSSKRWKENLEPIQIDSVWNLIHNEKLAGFHYQRNDRDMEWEYGFIAEECIEVVPDAVAIHNEEPIGVNYNQFVPLMWEAIRDIGSRLEKAGL